MKKFNSLLPISIFIIMAGFLWRSLSLEARMLPSSLLEKPVPQFSLPSLFEPGKMVSEEVLKKGPTLISLWASWCGYCRVEHPFIEELAEQKIVKIVGISYKDSSHDAKLWLQKHGNPYEIVLEDRHGYFASHWGIHGLPETFMIVDGKVCYHHHGRLTAEAWAEKFEPCLAK